MLGNRRIFLFVFVDSEVVVLGGSLVSFIRGWVVL